MYQKIISARWAQKMEQAIASEARYEEWGLHDARDATDEDGEAIVLVLRPSDKIHEVVRAVTMACQARKPRRQSA